MINKKLITTVLCLCPAFVSMTHAQDKLYPELFPLSDVQLLDGPFKHAQDLNRSVLLEYDVDRLLAPFLIEAGLKPKAEKFPALPLGIPPMYPSPLACWHLYSSLSIYSILRLNSSPSPAL